AFRKLGRRRSACGGASIAFSEWKAAGAVERWRYGPLFVSADAVCRPFYDSDAASARPICCEPGYLGGAVLGHAFRRGSTFSFLSDRAGGGELVPGKHGHQLVGFDAGPGLLAAVRAARRRSQGRGWGGGRRRNQSGASD